jgi:hypothetical protein
MERVKDREPKEGHKEGNYHPKDHSIKARGPRQTWRSRTDAQSDRQQEEWVTVVEVHKNKSGEVQELVGRQPRKHRHGRGQEQGQRRLYLLSQT